jgi:hypothetical protein
MTMNLEKMKGTRNDVFQNEQEKFYKIEGCNDEISKWSNDEVLITCIAIYDINKEEVYAMDKMVLIT